MELAGNVLRIAFETVLTIFCADLNAGVVHWFQDAYIREDTPMIGRLLGRPNIIHHHYPRYMTRNNWWQSSYDLVLYALLIVMTAWSAGELTWQVWLFAFLCMNANQIHKWTHRTREENGPVISFLQDKHLLQTQKHHLMHHKDPKDCRYCPLTNWLNPLLDAAGFWQALEWALARTTGLRRRADTSLRGAGPVPDWLRDVVPRRCTPATPTMLGD